ncbi:MULTISPECIES: DUF305 domain-containing protein [unclassified Streptomyces]|uniref:DUF305 domain-containing protein n=1 Tax=unclassified Streptomyces TaxID=2593676 RepID=UPI00166186D4|nr:MULTISPECIES: DUF305 domain-containing protein [unclassified Streptomyces]MBD0707045.1 DUF305 domain-containing protein [Streptomyces sp. CBMA291]MBD0714302.1 DUF305 domain-containing protein [Streptomyces sp. CBMA370]
MRILTQRPTRTLALAGAVTAAGLLLAACGTDGATGTATTPAPATASGPAAPGPFNEADVMFAQMMIPHHQQALEMAELAAGRAEDPEVKALVAAIEGAQDAEIRKMRSWLKGWGRPESTGPTSTGSASAGHESTGHGSGGHGMAGMMSEQDMKGLAATRGKAFDRTFAELMIAHHEGAVAMAREEQRGGGNATAKALADDVVRTQSAEISALRKILDRL